MPLHYTPAPLESSSGRRLRYGNGCDPGACRTVTDSARAGFRKLERATAIPATGGEPLMRTGLTSKRTGRFGLSQVTRTSALMLLAATLYGLTGVGSASAQSSYPDLDTAVPDLTKGWCPGPDSRASACSSPRTISSNRAGRRRQWRGTGDHGFRRDCEGSVACRNRVSGRSWAAERRIGGCDAPREISATGHSEGLHGPEHIRQAWRHSRGPLSQRQLPLLSTWRPRHPGHPSGYVHQGSVRRGRHR